MRANRQQARTRLLKLIRVRSAGDGKLFGFIGDISVGGMRINTHKPVKAGDQHKLYIELPQDISQQLLQATAQITWVGEGDERDSRDCGCRFLAIETSDREALLELARRYPMGGEEL